MKLSHYFPAFGFLLLAYLFAAFPLLAAVIMSGICIFAAILYGFAVHRFHQLQSFATQGLRSHGERWTKPVGTGATEHNYSGVRFAGAGFTARPVVNEAAELESPTFRNIAVMIRDGGVFFGKGTFAGGRKE